jgi:HK97 family phage portal protein
VSFWTWMKGNGATETPNSNPAGVPPASVAVPDYTPGDPDGVEFEGDRVTFRALPLPQPSAWDGWPEDWGVPLWDFSSRFNELIDIAWACLDLNASVLSTMPVYRTRNGEVIDPMTWMTNPDPTIYSSWHEFAKQLFWDYMLGEAFVLPIATGRDGYPLTFRVMPPWTIWCDIKGGKRIYRLGGETGPDVTDEILHIRYKSTTDKAHGSGPLDAAGARMLTAGVLAQYVRNMAATGGVPDYTLETDQPLNGAKAQELLDAYMTARALNVGAPPVLSSGVSLETHMHMSPKDMAMLEISQFTEARIAVLLGVPPFLVALPSGDSMTYSNVQQVFDFHDRSSLRPKAAAVMSALSGWSLPRGTNAELNRDEYSRPSFEVRADAWVKLVGAGIVSVDEVRAAERLQGDAPEVAITALTGGEV